MPLASFSARFAAFKVDILIFTILCELCHWIVRSYAPQYLNFPNFVLLYLVVTFFYYCYPTYKTGQTLGKKWMSIKVVGDKSDMTMKHVLIREIPGKTLSSFFFIGYLWFFRGNVRKTWHDILGRTSVYSNYLEEEMTFKVRAQHQLVSLVTIPASVILILFLMLYTSLPLDSIRNQIEQSGTHIGDIRGSIAGGIFMSEISRKDDDQDYDLKDVEVRFNLLAIITQKVFLIEKISVQSGRVEVPPGFTWWAFAKNLMAATAAEDEVETPEQPIRVRLDRLKLASLEIQNLDLIQGSKSASLLKNLSVHGLEKDPNGVRIEEIVFEIKGLTAVARHLVSADGKTDIQTIRGKVHPDLVPMLKAPLDFQVEGQFAEPFEASVVSGNLGQGKIKFKYAQKRLTATIDQLPIQGTVKNAAPIETLNLQWTTEGTSVLEAMMKQEASYQVLMCGATFKSAPGATVIGRSGSHFKFTFAPKPIPNLIEALTSPTATLDDFFEQKLTAVNPATPTVSADVPLTSNLCSYNPFMPPNQF